MGKSLNVFFHDKHVGTLAEMPDKRIAFQYSKDWLSNGFSISPLSLPLRDEVFVPPQKSLDIFHGLYGVFSDSLPDSWGELLLNRYLASKGIDVSTLSILDRLAYVGASGMGALEYRPAEKSDFDPNKNNLDFDALSMECSAILSSKDSDQLHLLYELAGPSGGARPKLLLNENGTDYIVKFPANTDPSISGKREYDYSICAKKCGINMTKTSLIPSKICKGYFKTERFDRQKGSKIHSLTMAGLLETDFRHPTCDYSTYMKAIDIITKGNKEDKEQMFKIMCFNVMTHNLDDHTKNFSFIYTEKKGWRLAPGYDLTYSTTYYGEQTTSVNGKGKNITDSDMISVGTNTGLPKTFCEKTIQDIKKETASLKGYLSLQNDAKKRHVSWQERVKEIEENGIKENYNDFKTKDEVSAKYTATQNATLNKKISKSDPNLSGT
ncbi:MAG: type II toxin-antitoxin system HipA family toxin [Lachnospiraceae bacterium]|nr:type II toxin-antitoxin system HipA family toxin [Lachnospiraceae bacterium]